MKTNHRSTTAAAFAVGVVLALLVGATGCSAFDSSDGDLAMDQNLSRGVDSAVAPEADIGSAAVSEEMAAEPYATGADAASVPQTDRLVIRTAGVRLDVDDVEASVAEIRSRAQEASAVVTDVQISTETDVPVYRYEAEGSLSDGAALSGWVTVRVPSSEYDTFVESIKDIGDVIRQSESESDVTQQHIDLSAQLANLKAQEERLREFFDQAVDVEDLLSIEQELTRVRAQIDSYEAQIAFLERQAAMSTVTIELVGPQPVVSPQGESWGFIEAITAGIRGAADVISFGIAFLIATSPLWVLGLIVFIVIRAIIRRRHRAPAQPPAEDQQL